MSITKAKTAFSAEFTHDFYNLSSVFKVNESLLITPAAATAELLRGARMLFRKTPKGFTVMYASYPDPPNSTTNFVPFVQLADTDMTFVLNLASKNRNEFMNYTKLNTGPVPPAAPTKEYSPNKIVYLTASTPGVMNYDLLDSLRPDLFTVDFQVSGALSTTTALVELKYESESFVTIYTALPNANGVFSAQVDLRGKRKGKYTLQATTTSPVGSFTTEFYVDKDLYGTDLFGIIKLRFDDAFYTTPGTFMHGFVKRIAKWRYFVVLRGTYSSQQLKVSGVGLTFTPSAVAGVTPFDGIPDPDIEISNSPTAIFLSDQYIPFEEEAIKIKLEQTAPSLKIVDSALPNPRLDGFDSDRYAQLDVPPGTPQKNISEMFVFVDDI